MVYFCQKCKKKSIVIPTHIFPGERKKGRMNPKKKRGKILKEMFENYGFHRAYIDCDPGCVDSG